MKMIASIVLICKSLWIKVSAKWLNVNKNKILYRQAQKYKKIKYSYSAASSNLEKSPHFSWPWHTVWPEKLKCFKVNLSDMFPCCCCLAMACMQCCLGVWQKDGGRCSGWWLKAVMNSSDVTFLRTSQGLVKRHSYFMQAVWALLWIDCFETYMVVT